MPRMSGIDAAQSTERGLRRRDLDPDPMRMFATWFDAARAADVPQVNAMTLATATPDGRPSARIVLLKGVDDRGGFVFYTNSESLKGRELEANPAAALVLYWAQLGRQVRVSGSVRPVDAAAADAYFASRPRMSQIGAWASRQGHPLPSREALDERVRECEARFGEGDVPRPEHWNGYALDAEAIEFWENRPNRLHDRFVYVREGGGWTTTRLSP